MLSSLLSVTGLLALCSAAAASTNHNRPTLVNVRIEGEHATIFEGPVVTRAHTVTTSSGGTHECNGLNNGANPNAGPTCTTALDDASKSQRRFTWDGSFDTGFDDYFITRIGQSAQTSTQFWGLLLDFQFTPVGGCQQEIKAGQEVLWAFDAFSKNFFLKATGPAVAERGKPVTYRVVDGATGTPVAGAVIGGATTDLEGKARVTFRQFGEHVLKAEQVSAIRSNRVVTRVL